MKTWPVLEMPVSDLLEASAPYNPRVLSKAAEARLRASLETHGLAGTLVFNRRTGRLVSGHQRARLLSEANVDRVSVTVVDLDEPEEKALNIGLNREDLTGDWDRSKLDELLSELVAGSAEAFEALRLDEMPQSKSSDLDRLIERITTEPEWQPGPRDVDPALVAEAVAGRIRSLSPTDLGSARLISVDAGTRAVLVLVNDPSHEDLADEVRQAVDSGSPSPLADVFQRFV